MLKKLVTERFSLSLIIVGLILFVFAIIMFFWQASIFEFTKQIAADKVGQFGDFIGGVVGSIFSLTGVILFYVALRAQREDFNTNTDILILQKEELELQRKELKETKEVFEAQKELMEMQQNDNRFFSLLDNHKQMIASFMKGEYKLGSGADFSEQLQNTYAEPVSGYEILDNIAAYWQNYFEIYSWSYKNKIILEYELLSKYEDCFQVMLKNTIASLHFRELKNLYLFIQEKLNNDSFYLNTLNVSLTHNERLIFEAAFLNFPSESEGLKYSLKNYFKPMLYVDFKNDKIPIVKANKLSFGRDHNWISIETDISPSEINLIIYTETDSGPFIINDIVNIDSDRIFLNNAGLLQSQISIVAALNKSALNFHEYPFHDKDAVYRKSFVFDVLLENDDKKFHFYFGFRTQEHERKLHGKLKRYELINNEVYQITYNRLCLVKDGFHDFHLYHQESKPVMPIYEKMNSIVSKYFEQNSDINEVVAKDLMEEFINQGLFKTDESDGLALKKFLDEFAKNEEDFKIPFAKRQYTDRTLKWYFVK